MRAAGLAAAAVVLGTTLGGGCDSSPTAPAPSPPAAVPPAQGSNPSPPATVPAALAVACGATPREGPAPLRVEFTASATGGTAAHAFLWEFGEGGSSTNPNPSFTYPTPGTFEAVVTVTSGGAAARCSRAIVVTRPEGDPENPPPARFLTVVPEGSRTYIIESRPQGIFCSNPPPPFPNRCSTSYAENTIVTLTARLGDGPAPLTWGGACRGARGTVCTVRMDEDKEVTVTR